MNDFHMKISQFTVYLSEPNNNIILSRCPVVSRTASKVGRATTTSELFTRMTTL